MINRVNARFPNQLEISSPSTHLRTDRPQYKCACGQRTVVSSECAECNKKRFSLQRRAVNQSGPATAPSIVHEVLRSPGRPLDPTTRTFMESRFNHNFGRVRAHTNEKAAASARSVSARAYTVGHHVVFAADNYAPNTMRGKRLLAHELAHVVQQCTRSRTVPATLPISSAGETGAEQAATRIGTGRMLPSQVSSPITVMRNLEDPTRFETVHRNIFVEAPGVGSSARQTWNAAAKTQIVQQFRDALQELLKRNPMSVMGTLRERTTEAAAERDAAQANNRIQTHFPFIPTSLSTAEIERAVTVLAAGHRPNETFVKQWLANRLIRWTDIEQYALGEQDPAYEALLTEMVRDRQPFDFTASLRTLETIIARQGWTDDEEAASLSQHRRQVHNKPWAWVIATLAGRVGAFAVEGQQITFSRGIRVGARRLTLLHELVHFYAHGDFRRWIEQTQGHRFYIEGFTEFLARQVMSADELSSRNQYQGRVTAIEQEVATFIPVDDIARAYFLGEVWRIEGISAVAQERFASDIGLQARAPRSTEVSQSRTGSGIVQVVRPRAHYRFMNLGVGESTPKPEHSSALLTIIRQEILGQPARRLRFVGHASAPGSATLNLRLARQRSAAFYALAQQAGVPASQLEDAARPPAEGESAPTAGNDDPIGRAFNRRVELFIISATTNQTSESKADE